jgi:hypothetical protein
MSEFHTVYGKIGSYGFARRGYDDPLSFQMAFHVRTMGTRPQTKRFVHGQCQNGAHSTAPARIVHGLMESLGVTRWSEIIHRDVLLKLNEEGEVLEVQNPHTLRAVNFAEQVHLSRADSLRLCKLPPMLGVNGPRVNVEYAVVEDVDFFLDPLFQFSLKARLVDGSLVDSGPFEISATHQRGQSPSHSPGTAVARLIDHFLAVADSYHWEDFVTRKEPVLIRVGLENGAIRYLGHKQDQFWCDLNLQAALCHDERNALFSMAA